MVVEKPVTREQLVLRLGCSAAGKTVLRDRYMAYPLSISPVFRLEEEDSRAYVYRMNTSPGLLAGDRIGMTLHLEDSSALYLADQAATKVHAMPARESERELKCDKGRERLDKGLEGDERPQAQVQYTVEVGEQATLEFLPEPLILFAASELRQTTEIAIAPTAGLSWGEIILPGRLARGEAYQFRECWSTLRLKTLTGELLLVETTRLLGQANRFSPNQSSPNQSAQSDLFSSGAVMGLLVLCLPSEFCSKETLTKLSHEIDALCTDSLSVASSILPGERGLFVRAVANTAQEMQRSFKAAADAVRKLRNQAPLPYSV